MDKNKVKLTLNFRAKKKISGYLFNYLLERVNAGRAAKHLSNHPQVAIFAFDHIGLAINQHGIYEREILETVMEFLSQYSIGSRSLCIDVGANIGNHSLFFSKYFSSVWSFEANPLTYKLLEINTMNTGNITTYLHGISDISGEKLAIKCDNANIGGSCLVPAITHSSENQSYVTTKRLDDLILPTSMVSLIKLDVEGYESKCLRGSTNLIKANKPIILIEQSATDIRNNSSESLDILRELGYIFFELKRGFSLGSSRIGRITSALIRVIFPYTINVIPITRFNRIYYPMIIAIHADCL